MNIDLTDADKTLADFDRQTKETANKISDVIRSTLAMGLKQLQQAGYSIIRSQDCPCSEPLVIDGETV